MIPLLIAGAAIMMAGQLKAGRDAKKLASKQAVVYEQNARILEENAELALQEGALQEQRHRQDVVRLLGKQTVAYAKSGVQKSGSAALVEADTMYQGELDALLIKYNASTRANALRADAANARAGADITRTEGRMREQASFFQAGGTLLTAMGQGAFGSLGSLAGASSGANSGGTFSGIKVPTYSQDYYR